MGRKSRVKPTEVEYKSNLIEPTRVDSIRQNVSFNLKCLTSKGNKFRYQEKDKNYFNKLLERLRDLSRMTKKELTVENSGKRSLRCHVIDFGDKRTTENCFGLPRESDLYDDAWQFEVSQNTNGRVHGYFIENVFYIVWLDPKHDLYPWVRP